VKTIRLLALLCAATAFSVPALATPDNGPSRYLTGSDLFNLEIATDPQISPDGKTIVYVRKSNDIMTDKARSTIWLIDTATGQQRPILAGSGDYSSPRWSPDGTRLAYVGAQGSSAQLFVRWMASGESARITGLPDSPEALLAGDAMVTHSVRSWADLDEAAVRAVFRAARENTGGTPHSAPPD